MRSRTNQLHRLEGLETRCLMAGNVTAIVQNGSLIITGDAEANQILIQEFMGDLNVLGVGTTVNGLANQSFPGVYKDVRVSLLAGDDTVDLAPDAIVSRDLVYKGGPGNNIFTGHPGSGVGRDLVLQGGVGNIAIDLDGTQVGRDLRATSSDTVFITSVGGTAINGQLRATAPDVGCLLADTEVGGLRMLVSSESLSLLDNVRVAGNVYVRGGTGNDTFVANSPCDFEGNLTVLGRGGHEAIALEGSVSGSLILGTGTGPSSFVQIQDLVVFGNLSLTSTGNAMDVWQLARLSLVGNMFVRSSGGDDLFYIDDSICFGAFNLGTGAGIDHVLIADNNDVLVHGKTFMHLGNGDDHLRLGKGGAGTADFRAAVSLNGGLGVDVLDDQLVSFLLPVASTDF